MEKRKQIIDLLNKCIIGESVANTADKILLLFDNNEQVEEFNCLGEDYAKGIKRCEEWCGEEMCKKPTK